MEKLIFDPEEVTLAMEILYMYLNQNKYKPVKATRTQSNQVSSVLLDIINRIM